MAVLVLSARLAGAADYYVAVAGDDANPGTIDEPFATVERGQTAASPGDTVYIRGGVYEFSGTARTVGVSFTKSGEQDRPIRYFAYLDETPIFDLFDVLPNERVTGLDVNASYLHIRGLEVRGVRQIIVGDSWSVRVRGNDNVLERLNVHDGEAPGIFITSGRDNLVLNCDSHHNYDPLEDGGNADGFGCHSTGGNNVFSGCRAYANSDDGFDFINAPGTCIVERSFAFDNGYVPDTTTASGNGAGFKAGGFGLDTSTFPATIPRHVVRQCVAFGNRAQGFYANHHPGGIDFFNNVAFGNGVNFNMLADVGESDHTLRNNVAMTPGTALSNFTGGTDDFNSWSLGVTVTADDFLSMDEALALAPRAADGSLPATEFMRLASPSDLIDAGEDVGIAFSGDAPDLGAFESGLDEGSGGLGGMAGMSGEGGNTSGAGGGGTGTGMGGAGGVGGGGGAASGAAGGGGMAGSGASGNGGTGGGTSGAAGSSTAGGGQSGASGAGASAGAGARGGSGNAGVGGSGTSGSGPVDSGDGPADEGGCACRTTPPRSTPLAVWLAGLAFVAALRRRRAH